jgi:glutamine amidotransferase
LIVVVDYGVGNSGAIANMLDYLGFDVAVVADAKGLLDASHLVLPGVGAFDAAMTRLRASGMVPALEQAVFGRGVPILGVCLGMQLLGRRSEEGKSTGLGWLAADSVKLSPPAASRLKVPHIGWSDVIPRNGSKLFPDGGQPRFYFVHSYHMRCDNDATIAAECDYGGRFICAVTQGNISGVQFHPEKSHKYGLDLYRRFVEKSNQCAPV